MSHRPDRKRFDCLACAVTLTAVLGLALTGAASASDPLASCDFGSRHPDGPQELEQFEFLIGNFDIRGRQMTENGWSEGYLPAYWEGRWVLGGFAIADYWYDTPPTGDGDPPGRGVNVRLYHESTKQWSNMWQHSRSPEVRTLTSEVRDDGLMHMWASHPDTSDQRHMTFHVVSDDHWYRIEERSTDGGKTWTPVLKLEAHRAPCPWQPPASAQ